MMARTTDALRILNPMRSGTVGASMTSRNVVGAGYPSGNGERCTMLPAAVMPCALARTYGGT